MFSLINRKIKRMVLRQQKARPIVRISDTTLRDGLQTPGISMSVDDKVLVAKALAAAGVKQGLDPELAARLARATVSGAGELLRQSPEAASQLRQNVTSPGGTTAAALSVLMRDGDGLPDLMAAAVATATKRGRELAG